MDHEEAVTTMAAERYSLGELHDEERERFEEHFFSCPECAEDVRDLATVTTGARELLRQPPLPGQSPKAEPQKQRAAAKPRVWRWLWPPVTQPGFAWASALAVMTLVAGAAAYQALHFRGLIRPQTPASFLLRPETRGEAAAIPTQKLGPFVLLEMDLPGASGDLQWDLRQTGSPKVIAQDTAAAPGKGMSFKVLVPSASLGPGEYTLTVRQAADPPAKSWFSKFRIAAGGR